MGLQRRSVVRGAVGGSAVLALSAALLLAPGGPGAQRAAAAGLTPFAGCADLEAWYREAVGETLVPYGGGGSWGGAVPLPAAGSERLAAASGAADASTAAESAGAGGLAAGPVGPGETGTNVQEAGVDEPDLVKSQGDRVVLVRADRLVVLDVAGDEPRQVGSLALPAGAATELLLEGDRALVLGTSWSGGGGPAVDGPPVDVPVPLPELVEPAPEPAEPAPAPPGSISDLPVSAADAGPPAKTADAEPVPLPEPVPASDGRLAAPDLLPGAPTTVLTLVDLSDPAAPAVVRTDEVEGTYVSAREHDGTARVVLTSTPALPLAYATSPDDEARVLEDNRKLLAAADAQDFLPQRVVRDAAGTVAGAEPLLDCAAVSHPAEQAGAGTATVLTLALGGDAAPTAVAVAADGDLVYASTDRLYVATTRGGWFRPVDVPADVAGWPAEVPEAVWTAVHAFDVTGPTTSYAASGEVEGWLLGRWAMSGYEGRLRLATTRDTASSPAADVPATDAAVSVLEERGRELTVVGSVGGLGRGEQVRAVRWFGDLATVVTFRQTDPLYTVDLADPASPRVVGELEVPGYSAYLHPLGDGLLLGVGQDATDDGRTLGTQVSTFDLRDLAAPARLADLVEPDSWSDVEGDSRQFVYLPSLRTVVLPVSGPTGSFLWALQVGTDGSISEAGRWSPGREGWLARAVPVSGDRLAVVVDAPSGSEVVLVTASALGELGSLRLG